MTTPISVLRIRQAVAKLGTLWNSRQLAINRYPAASGQLRELMGVADSFGRLPSWVPGLTKNPEIAPGR